MASRIAAAALVAAITVTGVLDAEFVHREIQNIPVERVAANLEAQLRKSPRDVDVLVNLARVHAMAFASKSPTVPVVEGRIWLGQEAPPHKQFIVKPGDSRRTREARGHLDRAIARYKEALSIDAEHQIAALGLGWALMHAGESAEAITTLRAVVAAAARTDFAGRDRGSVMHGEMFLGEEATTYLLRLLDPERDRAEMAQLRQLQEKWRFRPRFITPIAVPLANATAREIIDDNANVAFDLDGSGVAKRWTWIRPNAAWLVFDRRGAGEITSALQMFGSVTFWMFWENGYHALRSLDDNGDGEIRGAELKGLALWHDRNSNGKSDHGEVRPVSGWGIVALSCRYEYDATHPDEIAVASRGVTFGDGTARPTYDLVLRAAPAGSPPAALTTGAPR